MAGALLGGEDGPADRSVEGGRDAGGRPYGGKVAPLPPRSEAGVGPGDDPGPVLPDGQADEDQRPLQPAREGGDGGQHDARGLAGRRGQLGALVDVDAVQHGLGLGDARPGRDGPDGHGDAGEEGRRDAGEDPPPEHGLAHDVGLLLLVAQRESELEFE